MTRVSSARSAVLRTVVVVLSVAGCGSGGDEADDPGPVTEVLMTDAPTSVGPTADSPTTSEAASSEFSFSVARMLEEIPASNRPEENGTLFITMGDLDAATELAHAVRPPADAPGDLDPLLEWVNPITGFSPDPDEVLPVAMQLPQVVGYQRLRSNADIAAEFGWSVLDVRSFAEILNPPDTFTVLDAEVTVDELDSAIGARQGGVWRIGGEDGSLDVANRTPGRPLGESLRLAVDDDGLLGVSRSTPPVEEWLAGDVETLADDEQLTAVATALDDADVYSAMIVDAPQLAPDRHDGPAGTGELVLAPYDVLGLGLSVDDGRARGVFVYQHPDAEAAETNESRVRALFEDGRSVVSGQRLSELMSLDDVAVDGSTVVAAVTFVDRSPRIIWQMFANRDLPAAHS